MGQEIVYCFKCQKRVLGTDYMKGLAFQLENNTCCSGCAVQVLDTLPPKAKEQLLAKMFKATQESSNKAHGSAAPSPATRRPAAQPGSGSRHRLPAATRSNTPLFAGIGAAVALVLVLVIMLSPGRPAPPPAVPPKPPPAEPGPSAEEKRRAETAKEAVQKAREFALAHPKDLEAQAQRWRVARVDAERTGYEADVQRELDKIQILAKEAAAKAVADLDREARALAGRKEFKAAFDFLGRERSRAAAPTWSADIDRLEREIRDAATRAFAELKEKAVAARDRGAGEDVTTARAEVARWGLAELVADLDAAVEVAWRRVFDGKTLKGFPSLIGNAWRVENGMLIHDNGVDNAAITSDNFGIGEFRIRFDCKEATLLVFRYRLDSTSMVTVELRNQVLDQLQAGGEHEIILSARKDASSATLDGKVLPVLVTGQPSAGRLQFNTVTGHLRIKSLDFREFR